MGEQKAKEKKLHFPGEMFSQCVQELCVCLFKVLISAFKMITKHDKYR